MGKRIMHSARALFLTFLALEKSKSNSTFYEDYATAVERKNYTAAVHPEKSGKDLHRSGKRSTPEQKIVIIPKV
jgi:imidazoleglycerol phosphate synthase glutamine amidotransferase subunit HisH